MPKRCFLANIGQRDLAVDFEGLGRVDEKLCEKMLDAAQKKNLRVLGGLAVDNFRLVSPFLSAPILTVALKELKSSGEMPNEIILAGTKQKDKKFLAGDTFRNAEALALLLEKQFPGSTRFSALEINGAPNDLNAMLDEYGDICRKIKATEVYALCTGGTPACNMALSLRAIECFGERCTVFHVAEGAEKPTRLNTGRYIFAQHRKATLKRLVKRGDFDAIAEDKGYAKPVRSLARAAAARLNFNFKESQNILIMLKAPIIEDSLVVLRRQGQILAAGNDPKATLSEVYWNAIQKWRRDECSDFLGRVWRLLEGSLQDVMIPIIESGNDRKKFQHFFEEWAARQPKEFRDCVLKDISKNKHVSERIRPSIPVLIKTLGFLLENNTDALSKSGFSKYKAQKLKKHASSLRPLIDMRNDSIMAHGFGGVWKNSILETVKVQENEGLLFDELRGLLECQDITLEENPFDCFAEALIKLNGEMNYDAD